MPPTDPNSRNNPDKTEIVTRWALVGLAALAAGGAIARVFDLIRPQFEDHLDQTTLLYLAVAGVLLLLRQMKSLSFGQLKVEMIERLRERQAKQEERLDDINLILPLLLPDSELTHIKKLSSGATAGYEGTHALRTELRRLRSLGLISKKPNRNVADIKDNLKVDLDDYVELTQLGRRWASRVQEMESTDAQTTKNKA